MLPLNRGAYLGLFNLDRGLSYSSARTVSRPKASTRLTPAASRRQGETTRMAMILLGREAAIEFMNAHHDGLGGRPIDLAIASDEGRTRVELALSDQCIPSGQRNMP